MVGYSASNNKLYVLRLYEEAVMPLKSRKMHIIARDAPS